MHITRILEILYKGVDASKFNGSFLFSILYKYVYYCRATVQRSISQSRIGALYNTYESGLVMAAFSRKSCCR